MKHGTDQPRSSSQFYQDWLIVLAIMLLAACLRGWQLGDSPPGLYRDEAFNGLDALGVLDGVRPLFFTANNGREPLLIYSIALAVWQFGRTAFAIRLPAAVFGTLTVAPFYFLTKRWANRRTALFAALLWAITLWPIHLSRVGFRTVLLPFFLSLAAYLLTVAVQRSTHAIWLFALAGVVYGISFYTYLAARLSLVGLVLFVVALLLLRRTSIKQLATYALPFGVATVVTVLPLLVALVTTGELTSGRTGDVSILSADVNGGNPLAALGANFGRTLAMFFIKGDDILRHNPAGRPVFDWFMVLPFLYGVVYCVRHWRRPVSLAIFIWIGVMLAGTLFAEDAPHFLRAAGVLPVLLIFPALGLSHLSNWSKLPSALGKILSGALIVGSCVVTVNDYFGSYAQQPDTYYLFEGAARALAENANSDAANSVVLIDEQFLAQWQAVPFLLQPSAQVETFTREAWRTENALPAAVGQATVLYVWPYEGREFVPQLVPDGARVMVQSGELMRLDFEETAYPQYVRYAIFPEWEADEAVTTETANFDNLITVGVSAEVETNQPVVHLTWTVADALSPSLSAFVHVIERQSGQLIGQADGPFGSADWLAHWWRPEIFVEEKRRVPLPVPFDAEQHAIFVGVYDAASGTRLPILDHSGTVSNDSLEVSVKSLANR